MNGYTIFVDSACDISPAVMNEWGVKSESLTFKFENSDKEYLNGDMAPSEFYGKMRAGEHVSTAAINIGKFKEGFEREVKEGNDILYLGFSSGLSTTYNSARIAAEDVSAKYPDRRIITIDTLSASAGYALLIYLTVQKKNSGADIIEAARFARDIKLSICHWFTVDDLKYLKRGGRVSQAAAIVGGLLGIKPVLHVDNDGHLINVLKVRGRNTALTAIADKYSELAKENIVFISHGDCINDAETMASMLKERGADVKLITDIGPVIGAHSGPGTLAVFFVGKNR